MSRGSRFTIVTFVSTAVLIASAPDARGQDEAFLRGIQARDRGQWQAAAANMREAIKVRPAESREKVGSRLGFGGTEYLPYYFLGEAHFELGQCAEAVSAWAISEQQKAIEGRADLLKRLRSGYAECEKRGVLPPTRLDTALKAALQLYTEVNGLARSLSTLAEANLDVWRSEASLRDQFDRATAELKTANTRYQSAQTTRSQTDLQESSAASERARAILVGLQAGLNSAIDSQRTAQSLLREVGEAIAGAEALNNTIAGKKVPFTPAMTTSQQEGRDGVSRARERLVEGARTLSVPTLLAARTLANDASTRFRQLLDEIAREEKVTQQRDLADALTRAADAFSLLDGAVATLERFSAQRPGVLPQDKVAERDAAQREVVRVRRGLDAARKTENLGGVTDATRRASELRDRLNVLIAAFGPLTLRDRGLNAVLEEGARLFLDGQYQQAVAALEPGETFGEDVPLRLHVHLFKAASLYQLFVRSGERDQALRAQAMQEVEHCKAIDSAFHPNDRAFSPKFISFYQGVSGASTSAAAATPPAAQP